MRFSVGDSYEKTFCFFPDIALDSRILDKKKGTVSVYSSIDK